MQNNPGLAPRPQAQPPRGEEQLPAFNLPPVSTTPRSKAAGPANLDQQAQARPALPLPTYSYTLPSYAPTPDATAGTGAERTVAGALAVLAGMDVTGQRALIARLTLPQAAAAGIDWSTITPEQLADLCEEVFFLPAIRGK